MNEPCAPNVVRYEEAGLRKKERKNNLFLMIIPILRR
jgi:hypothetical protein